MYEPEEPEQAQGDVVVEDSLSNGRFHLPGKVYVATGVVSALRCIAS